MWNCIIDNCETKKNSYFSLFLFFRAVVYEAVNIAVSSDAYFQRTL